MNSECDGSRVNVEHGARHHLIGAVDGDRYDGKPKLLSEPEGSVLEGLNVSVVGASSLGEDND